MKTEAQKLEEAINPRKAKREEIKRLTEEDYKAKVEEQKQRSKAAWERIREVDRGREEVKEELFASFDKLEDIEKVLGNSMEIILSHTKDENTKKVLDDMDTMINGLYKTIIEIRLQFKELEEKVYGL